LALAVAAAVALVFAGFPRVPDTFLFGLVFLVGFYFTGGLFVQLLFLSDDWRSHRWLGLLPLLSSFIAVPVGLIGASARMYLIPLWCSLNHERYETVASTIRAGTYEPTDLGSILGFGGSAIRNADQVVAVHFTLARHGRLCSDYLRIYDEQHYQLGSPGNPVGGGWYLVTTFCTSQSGTGWTEIGHTWLVAERKRNERRQ
jgi:hypothetical protein